MLSDEPSLTITSSQSDTVCAKTLAIAFSMNFSPLNTGIKTYFHLIYIKYRSIKGQSMKKSTVKPKTINAKENIILSIARSSPS